MEYAGNRREVSRHNRSYNDIGKVALSRTWQDLPRREPYLLQRKKTAEHPVEKGAFIEPAALELKPRGLELGNKELPIYVYRDEIVDAVKNNQVTIIKASTGTGKSTQVPQFLYDAGFSRTITTQPRRLAANGVAGRTRDEVQIAGEELGFSTLFAEQMADDMVGCRTADRSASTEKKSTKILTVTDGLQLVRQFNDRGVVKGEVLIIDESHEANINIEILMAEVHRLLPLHPEMRVVLMSATLESGRLQDYYQSAIGKEPAIISIEAPMYDIESQEKPYSTVVKEVLYHAQTKKTILVFVPGLREIDDVIESLDSSLTGTARILPLHGRMSKEAQDRIYIESEDVKIIVATNVAQTSVTIPDVEVVVDSGLARQNEIDESGDQGLRLVNVSQDDIVQRRGRTGRTCPGLYVLTKYDEESEFVSEKDRPKHREAEIRRSNIQRTVLRVAGSGSDLAELTLMHPIEHEQINSAKASLYQLGAFDVDGVLTDTGRKMDKYLLEPYLARMMVHAESFSPELRVQLAAITAVAEIKGLQDFSYGAAKEWRDLIEETTSDYFAYLELYMSVEENKDDDDFLARYSLEQRKVDQTKALFDRHCQVMGLDQGLLQRANDSDKEYLKKCITAGMIGRVYRAHSLDKLQYIEQEGYPRKERGLRAVSGRSSVKNVYSGTNLVAGQPYSYQKHDGKLEKLVVCRVLENVQAGIDLKDLAAIHRNSVEWRTLGLHVKDNQLISAKEAEMCGESLGFSEEVTHMEMTAEAREIWMLHFLNNPSEIMKIFLDLKREHEEVLHLSPKKIKGLLNQEKMEMTIQKAIPSDGRFGHQISQKIDERLLKEIDQHEKRLKDKKIIEIKESSPRSISIGGQDVDVHYYYGVPRIKIKCQNTQEKAEWARYFHEHPEAQKLPNDKFGRTVSIFDQGKPRSLKNFIAEYLPNRGV